MILAELIDETGEKKVESILDKEIRWSIIIVF